jgi:WD40 repeat protein
MYGYSYAEKNLFGQSMTQFLDPHSGWSSQSVAHKEIELMRVFKNFNINQSGAIDHDELVLALQELGVTTCLYTARRLLHAIDLDQSGMIEAHDFCRFFAAASNEEQVKQILSLEALKYINYKTNAQSGDSNFSVRYRIPECHRPESRFIYHMDVVQSVSWLNELDFASGSLDGSICLWEVGNPKPVHCIRPTGKSVYSLSSIGSTDKIIASFASSPDALALVDCRTGDLICIYEGHEHTGVTSTDTSGNAIVSGSSSGKCLLHDISNSKPLSLLIHSGPHIESVAYGKSMIAVCHHSGHVSLLDPRSESKRVNQFEAALGKLTAIRFRSDYELITGGDDLAIRRFDIRKITPTGGSIGSFLGHTSCISSLEIGGNYVLSGANDGSVRIWSETQAPSIGGVKFAVDETSLHGEDPSEAMCCLVGHNQAVKGISYRNGGAKNSMEILTGSSDTCINRYTVLN